MFLVEGAKVFVILAVGQGKEATWSPFHFLYSPTLDVRVLKKVLKSLSDYKTSVKRWLGTKR